MLVFYLSCLFVVLVLISPTPPPPPPPPHPPLCVGVLSYFRSFLVLVYHFSIGMVIIPPSPKIIRGIQSMLLFY